MDENAVREIITHTLEISDTEPDASQEKQWDSMAHVALLVALDTAFEGKLANVEELQDAYSLENIVAVLRKHGLLS